MTPCHVYIGQHHSLKDYRIQWDLLQAKDYGVPQNRPRVIMVGIREDVMPGWVQQNLLEAHFDAPTAVKVGFIPKPSGTPPTVPELLSDLEDPDFLSKSATTGYPTPGKSVLAEVYPSLWNRSYPVRNRTPDQHDAYSIARWMRETDARDLLAGHFNPALPPDEQTRADVEGWILGVR